jgi:predicted dinucleotide-binding enzyme
LVCAAGVLASALHDVLGMKPTAANNVARIGIIGAGALGTNVARTLANSGLSATIANRRGPESLTELVRELGPSITAGTVREAASADIVLLAVRWVDLETALRDLPPWDGRIVIDGTNPVAFLDPGSPEAKDPNNPLAAYGLKLVDLGGTYSSAIVRKLVPGARLVKAFNHLDVRLLPQPGAAGGRRVLFYSGDDADAKATVRKVLEQTGHFPVDLGVLDIGGPMASLPFGPLAVTNFIAL